jgi:hypothetical protein
LSVPQDLSIFEIAQKTMNTSLMLILSAVLVITCGVLLAAFMNTLGEYDIPTQKNLKFQIVQDDKNENEAATDFDLETAHQST